MASTFVQVFTTHRHSVFLYLTSILVDEIGERYSSDLQKLFEALAGPTLEKVCVWRCSRNKMFLIVK